MAAAVFSVLRRNEPCIENKDLCTHVSQPLVPTSLCLRLLQLLSTIKLERLVLRGGIAALGPGWKALKQPASRCQCGFFTACCVIYPRGQAGSKAFFFFFFTNWTFNVTFDHFHPQCTYGMTWSENNGSWVYVLRKYF